MFLRALINPKPSIILFFIAFCIFLLLIPLIQFKTSVVFANTYLHPLIVIFLGLLIPCFISIGLNNIIYDKNIIRKDSLLVAVIFILISSPFVNTINCWGSCLLLLFLFNYLLDSYQKSFPFSQFYNASILLGLITFIHPALIYLILLFFISGINYSNLSWRVFLIILLGIITPYLFYFFFAYLFDAKFLTFDFFAFSAINPSNIKGAHLSKIIWGTIMFLIILVSFVELFSWLYKKSIKSRRTFMTIIWFFIISILIAIYSGWEYLYFSLLPLAIIIGNYFVYTRKRTLANILFLLLLTSSFYYKYMIVF